MVIPVLVLGLGQWSALWVRISLPTVSDYPRDLLVIIVTVWFLLCKPLENKPTVHIYPLHLSPLFFSSRHRIYWVHHGHSRGGWDATSTDVAVRSSGSSSGGDRSFPPRLLRHLAPAQPAEWAFWSAAHQPPRGTCGNPSSQSWWNE